MIENVHSVYNQPSVYNQGGGIAYKGMVYPSMDVGRDGDMAIVFADVRFTNLGTIIPVQSDMTNCFGSNTTVWNAFDGNTSTRVANSDFWPIEIGYDFGSGNEKSICAVSLTYYSSGLWFYVRGSNDRKNWKTLAVCNGSRYGSATISVTFENKEYFRYYSVVVHNNRLGGNSYIYVSKIGMTDDRSVMKAPNTPTFFVKMCGVWNYDMIGTAFDCVQTAVYRPQGRNPSTSISKYIGPFSNNLRIEIEGKIDSSLFIDSGYTGGAFIGWDNNNQSPFKLLVTAEASTTTFSLKLDTLATSSITTYTNTLKQHNFFKIIVDKDVWSLWMDDTLIGSATISNWSLVTGMNWGTTCYVLGGKYNGGESSQLGFKSMKIVDNNDGHLVCDIVGAKRSLDNTFGFFDRNIGGYFGFDANYVKEMV